MSRYKPTVGVDDLATLYPDIAAEADGWDPTEFKKGSNKRLPWKCKTCGYEWKVSPNNRTGNGTGCPKCAGKLPLESESQSIEQRLTDDGHGVETVMQAGKLQLEILYFPSTLGRDAKGRLPWTIVYRVRAKGHCDANLALIWNVTSWVENIFLGQACISPESF